MLHINYTEVIHQASTPEVISTVTAKFIDSDFAVRC